MRKIDRLLAVAALPNPSAKSTQKKKERKERKKNQGAGQAIRPEFAVLRQRCRPEAGRVENPGRNSAAQNPTAQGNPAADLERKATNLIYPKKEKPSPAERRAREREGRGGS